MNTCLRLRVAAVEGALLRMLGVIEHRGFRVLACHTQADPAGEVYQIRLDLAGERDPAVLCRQLARLYDVREVECEAETPATRVVA